MPQDVPLEAGATLAFTPECLKHLDDAPVFYLRAATWREKSFRTELSREYHLTRYTEKEVRAEILNGVRALNGEEKYDELSTRLTEYWQALDDFALQRQEDSSLKWEVDPEVEQAIVDLIESVNSNWRPVGKMNRANGKFDDYFALFTIATTVLRWTGFDVKRELEEGYLSLDCANAISERLFAVGTKADPENARLPFIELYLACLGRYRLDREEEKNSVSPSPSETSPEPSIETIPSAKAGRSRASAASMKTPASA